MQIVTGESLLSEIGVSGSITAFQAEGMGSNPLSRFASLAQLEEQLFCKQCVVGSNPTRGFEGWSSNG